MNPFLSSFNTKFESVPFHEIKKEHYLPALKELLAGKKVVLEEVKNEIVPTFENIIDKIEEASHPINIFSHTFFNLLSSNTDDEMQTLAQEISKILTEFENDVALDAQLFKQVKSVYENRAEFNLSKEQDTLITNYYKEFTRNGALLSEDKKDQLRKIDTELAELSLKFGDNVLKDKNSFELFLNKEELVGCPEGFLESAAFQAKEKGQDGKFFINLDYPSYSPVMTYAENRALREKLYRAMSSVGSKGNEFDNKNIVKKLASLRFQRAQLLGFDNHAHFVLEERMASHPKTVEEFLDELKKHSLEVAKHEMQEVKKYAHEKDHIEEIYPWDTSYYFEKLKKETFDFDKEKLRPYFKLDNVIQGAFEVANRLYGIKFVENTEIPIYHKDVKTFEVLNSHDQHVGVFYTDFFPRPSKRGGAWMTAFREQYQKDGSDMRPHIAIVCNFTKPTGDKPSLLSFDEVLTLFHEFGHALHGLLSQCRYQSVSGTNVFWDFVELPSQIMENWCYEKECLDLFAEHYETGEKIPEELITKIKETSTFHEARATVRQLSFGILDMAWHGQDPTIIENVDHFESEVLSELRLVPEVQGANLSTQFSHIFQGGYSAGYYSYKWAEVLDADAFEYFKENGIFNKEIATSFYENVLSKGGSENPMDLYKKFRGKEPDPKALLRRSGLI